MQGFESPCPNFPASPYITKMSVITQNSDRICFRCLTQHRQMSVITQKTDNICDGGVKKITKQSVLMHYSDNICD
jgi:hypothetical protein